MNFLAPAGPVYQAGTLSGNPLAMAAGLATLQSLKNCNPYAELEKRGKQWVLGMRKAATKAGVNAVIDHCGSMVGMVFTTGPVNNYADGQRADTEMFKRYFRGMLDAGIYIAPSAFEVGVLSTAHTQEIVEETVASASCVLSQL